MDSCIVQNKVNRRGFNQLACSIIKCGELFGAFNDNMRMKG